eukprot:gb/GEZN01002157.1/.p1 GENE.gb/GEZN01002157.1/~~gb/GEZN01002157.1/.p1  ORF type:complete len:765 (-),score=69.33 gb/GEZN01002157.1/:284-2578(-)
MKQRIFQANTACALSSRVGAVRNLRTLITAKDGEQLLHLHGPIQQPQSVSLGTHHVSALLHPFQTSVGSSLLSRRRWSSLSSSSPLSWGEQSPHSASPSSSGFSTFSTLSEVDAPADEMEESLKGLKGLEKLTGIRRYRRVLADICEAGQKKTPISAAKSMLEVHKLHDTWSFNVLLTGYYIRHMWKEVRKTYARMVELGVPPSHRTFAILIRAGVEGNNAPQCYKAFNDLKAAGFKPLPGQYTCFMFLESRKQNPDRVLQYYDMSREAWPSYVQPIQVNQVMHALVSAGRRVEMQKVYDDAIQRGLIPNEHTFTTLLSVYSRAKDLKKVKQLVADILKRNIKPNPHLLSAMLGALGRMGKPEEADEIFRQMTEEGNITPRLHHYIQLIHSHAAAGNEQKALHWFKKLPVVTEIGFTALIEAFARSGHLENMIAAFKEMQARDFIPTLATYSALIGGFVYKHDYYTAIAYFADMEDKGIVPNPRVYGTFFVALGRLGDVHQMRYHFRRMCDHYKITPNLANYHSIMSGLARQGQHELVLSIYKQMLDQGLKPDGFIFDVLIASFARAGDTESMMKTKSEMEKADIRPNAFHYSNIIWGFTRKNQVKEAVAMLEETKLRGIRVKTIVYNIIIRVLAREGNQHEVGVMLDEMEFLKLVPDEITLTNVLLSINKTGVQFDDRLQKHIRHMDVNLGLRPVHPCPYDMPLESCYEDRVLPPKTRKRLSKISNTTSSSSSGSGSGSRSKRSSKLLAWAKNAPQVPVVRIV